MHFRLTYTGPLMSHQDGARQSARALHVHAIRKVFHLQLSALWRLHPVLRKERRSKMGVAGTDKQVFPLEGFSFDALVTQRSGLICALDVLMLRVGEPGAVIYDLDNRLKTIFDALRMPKGADELGAGSARPQVPASDGSESPFYVLLEDDKLITHVSVESDILLEPVAVPGSQDSGVRLVLGVTVRPYDVTQDNLAFA